MWGGQGRCVCVGGGGGGGVINSLSPIWWIPGETGGGGGRESFRDSNENVPDPPSPPT